MEPISFRLFMELEDSKVNMFTQLADDLGVDPKAFLGLPQPASFFKLGDIYNLGMYKIVGIETDDEGHPTHCKVQLINHLKMPRKRYKVQRGTVVRIPDDEEDADDEVKLIPVDQVQNLIVQALQQQQAPEMGGLPGGEMPGMGMGMM